MVQFIAWRQVIMAKAVLGVGTMATLIWFMGATEKADLDK